VCTWESEKERDRERKSERERGRKREREREYLVSAVACGAVTVVEREGQRENERTVLSGCDGR